MAVKYSRIFTAIDGNGHELVTILVKSIKPRDRETLVVIRILEGEYETQEAFQDAREYTIKGWEKSYTRDKGEIKLYSSITLMLPDARRLAEALNEALQASEEG